MAWPHIPGLPCALGAPWGNALAEGQAGTQGRWALLEKSHISHLGLWCCPPCSHLPVQRGKENHEWSCPSQDTFSALFS